MCMTTKVDNVSKNLHKESEKTPKQDHREHQTEV